MPEKTCPDCQARVHVRKRVCPCGFVFPKAKKKAQRAAVEPQDAEYTFNGWKRVPARTRLAKCGTCTRKMKGGMIGWHSAYNDGDKYWWCEVCLKDFKDETFYKLTDES